MRKLFIVLPFLLLLIGSFWSSCKKDDLFTLQGGDCDTCTAVCDTAFEVSYANDIVPILEADCYVCHNAFSAPVEAEGNVLEGYSNLLPYAQDGRLMGTITHADGYPAMPQDDDKLSDCKIARIEAWIRQGALNN